MMMTGRGMTGSIVAQLCLWRRTLLWPDCTLSGCAYVTVSLEGFKLLPLRLYQIVCKVYNAFWEQRLEHTTSRGCRSLHFHCFSILLSLRGILPSRCLLVPKVDIINLHCASVACAVLIVKGPPDRGGPTLSG